jgi:hypothetical protein
VNLQCAVARALLKEGTLALVCEVGGRATVHADQMLAQQMTQQYGTVNLFQSFLLPTPLRQL